MKSKNTCLQSTCLRNLEVKAPNQEAVPGWCRIFSLTDCCGIPSVCEVDNRAITEPLCSGAKT